MPKDKKREKWTLSKIQKEALKHTRRIDFQKKSPNAYSAALRYDALEDVCSHMKPNFVYWTDEMLKEEALKYKHKVDFKKGNESAYAAVRARGLLDESCSHMTKKLYSRGASNIIYLWNIKNTNVYKIGVTSKNRGMGRINSVAKKHNVEPVILAYAEVEDAFAIEKELHNIYNIGQDIITEGDGVTEFRTLKYFEVIEILDYIKQEMLDGRLVYPEYA